MDKDQDQPRKRVPLSERNLAPETVDKIMAMISKKVVENLVKEGKIKRENLPEDFEG